MSTETPAPTPQPDAAKMTPTPERFERDHWLPLYVDDCKNYTHNEETISEGYHHIDGGRGFYDEARPQSGICFSGVMSKEQADFIATACNAHARLLAENAALVKALEESNALRATYADAGDAGMAEARYYREMLEWLHTGGERDLEGYEWGVYRVKWSEQGQPVSVLATLSDYSDLRAEMVREKDAKVLAALALHQSGNGGKQS